MSPLFITQTIFEILIALFVVWCFLNEEKVVRIGKWLRRKFLYAIRKKKVQNLYLKRHKLNTKSLYTPEKPSNDPLNVA